VAAGVKLSDKGSAEVRPPAGRVVVSAPAMRPPLRPPPVFATFQAFAAGNDGTPTAAAAVGSAANRAQLARSYAEPVMRYSVWDEVTGELKRHGAVASLARR
jgi:hypothetical protein